VLQTAAQASIDRKGFWLDLQTRLHAFDAVEQLGNMRAPAFERENRGGSGNQITRGFFERGIAADVAH
jgi:hypothetical protein